MSDVIPETRHEVNDGFLLELLFAVCIIFASVFLMPLQPEQTLLGEIMQAITGQGLSL